MDRTRLIEASRLYHERNLTQAQIARQLGVSRPTVSRMLTEARDLGLVRVIIADDESVDTTRIENEVLDRYPVRSVHVVNGASAGPDFVLHRTAQASARIVSEHITDGDRIGLAWGRTLFELVCALPARTLQGVQVVQVMGNIDNASVPSYAMEILTTAASRLHAEQASALPCPILVANASIRRSLTSDLRVKEVLARGRDCTTILLNLALPDESSCLYRSGYIGPEELKILQGRRSVGSIAGHFVDVSGSIVAPELDTRTIGVPLHDIRRARTVITCVADQRKAGVLHAALISGLIDVLTMDSDTARALLLGNWESAWDASVAHDH
jgi:deoxyribonucleoside regulator